MLILNPREVQQEIYLTKSLELPWFSFYAFTCKYNTWEGKIQMYPIDFLGEPANVAARLAALIRSDRRINDD